MRRAPPLGLGVRLTLPCGWNNAEPLYYEFMDKVIENLVRAFPNITAIHLNHDEIRGMARDSRSLRLGLSNAELLARDINALQALARPNRVLLVIQKGTRVLISLWDSLMFGRVLEY